MDSSIFRISLDIHRQTTQTHLGVKKGDTARKIVASLSDGGRPYRIGEGCHAVFKGKKPDGNVLYNDCAIMNNCIVYEFTEQTAASAGYMACEFQLYGADGQIITCPRFAITVSGLVYDDGEVESTGEFTALAQAMTDLADLKANGLKGECDAFYVLITQDGAGATKTADKTFAEMMTAYEAARPIYGLITQTDVLNLVHVDPDAFVFQGIVGAVYQRVIIRSDNTVAYTSEKYVVTGDLLSPLYVTLGAENGGYVADRTFEDIRAAYDQKRSVYCMAGTMRLPLAGISADTAMFSASNKNNIFRVVVKADGTVEHQAYKCVLEEDLQPAVTDEIYFDITGEGEVSLKPEYRGAGQSASIPQSVSDNGVGRAGTQNKELPEEIVIPEAVRGITVTSFAKGMFWGNRQVRRIEIPATVSEIPTAFCREAWNVTEVRGTEQVKILNSFAFYACGITRASFPALEVFNGTKHFSRCAYLAVANLGTTIRAIPEGCFEHCERLVDLRCSSEVNTVGKTGFYMTFRLKELPFLGSLTDVGDYGFLISRVNVDAINPDCRFGVRATSKDFRGADYWTEAGEDATQVNTPLYSTFNQDNPLWKDKTIGNLARTWDTGCIIVCAAMAYSSLEKKDLDSPEEFVDAVYAADSGLKNVDPGSQIDGIEQYLEAVGYDVVRYPEFNTANLQALYDALAGGALVIHRCLGDATDGNHDVLIHGINADGEVLCVDPSSASVLIGRSDAITYSMPIQTRTRAAEGTDKDYFWVVRKN